MINFSSNTCTVHYCLLLLKTCYRINLSWVDRQQLKLQQLRLTQRCLAAYWSSRQPQIQSIKHCQLVLAAVRSAALHLLQSPRHRFMSPWTRFTWHHQYSLRFVTTYYIVHNIGAKSFCRWCTKSEWTSVLLKAVYNWGSLTQQYISSCIVFKLTQRQEGKRSRVFLSYNVGRHLI